MLVMILVSVDIHFLLLNSILRNDDNGGNDNDNDSDYPQEAIIIHQINVLL